MAVKLTIGTAVYNVGEAFIREHLDGLVGQLNDETELLLIDDCSTDNSGEICKQYAESYSHVRYINMGKNGGLSCVRNRTINEAEGRWIFFADGDDLLSDYFVQTTLSLCEGDYDVIIIDREVFSDKKPVDQPCGITSLKELPEGSGRALSISCLTTEPLDNKAYNLGPDVFYHAAWGAFYRRDFLLENNLTFPEGQRRPRTACSIPTLITRSAAYLPYVMYYYRKNMQGITKRYSADFTKMANSLIRHHRECMEKLYPGDENVEKLYRKYRVISLLMDSMKLNFFHKDNTLPKGTRKEGFLELVRSEPFKSAIRDYGTGSGDWWGRRIPITLAGKEKFDELDLLFRHTKIFRLYGGLSSLLKNL